MFTSWVDQYAENIHLSAELRPEVAAVGARMLRDVSGDVETGTSEAAAASTPTTPF
jgi:hypothetical protein